MPELRDALKNNHEIEFTLHEKTYLIQPEEHDSGLHLTMWQLASEASCIADIPLAQKNNATDDEIELLLSQKCFDGESFFSLSDHITVTTVY